MKTCCLSDLTLVNNLNFKFIGRVLVKYALSYIRCSRCGMLESDFLELLAPPGYESVNLGFI